MVPLLSNFFIQFNFFGNLFFLILVFGIIAVPFFLLLVSHLLLVSLFSLPLLWISYLHLLSVLGIQFSSKSFDNDTIEYYIGLPDLNLEPETKVDKCEIQLGICRNTAICFDYC